MVFGSTEMVAVELACRGRAIGAACRAEAVLPVLPGGHLFAIRDHAGRAMVLAHDAFEAARWFLGIEWGDMLVPWDGITIRLQRDWEIAEEELDRRWADPMTGYRCWKIDEERKKLARARATFLGVLDERAAAIDDTMCVDDHCGACGEFESECACG